jgi:dTDP-4-dehydrorhamnose reductase
MKVLVLGGTGMLGHALVSMPNPKFELSATVRGSISSKQLKIKGENVKIIENIDADQSSSIQNAIDLVDPDYVINAIGLVKQLGDSTTTERMKAINTDLPQFLANVCVLKGIRLIHFSTDCVFSGNRGNYHETDTPDPVDLYGQTKLEGEISAEGCTVIRTSFIGQEIRNHLGLLEWAISQKGEKIKGYTQAFFSGLTIIELRQLLWQIIESDEDFNGIWHMASHRISKFELLTHIDQAFDLKLDISPDKSVKCDRSMDGSRLSKRLNYTAPSWALMVDNLAQNHRKLLRDT